MSKIMLVNVTHMEESRVAVVEDGVRAAYEIETINRTNIKGNIHNAVVESVHPSLEAAFVKISSELKGFLPIDEVNFRLLPVRSDNRKSGRIGQHLTPGQKIMAQVVREPFSGKPPTVSTYFSLPGRYLVLMPGVDTGGVSRKIEDSEQRERLTKLIEELRTPEGFGVIIRTAGMGQTKTELQRDLRYLLRLWESIQRGSGATEFPGLVYREADLVIRTIRDHFTPDIEEVWIDSEETYEKAAAFMRDVMPAKAKALRLYTGERPLFNKFNLEEQIERIYKRRVPLPSGGEIVIDGTEALTAIDVNSARSRKQSDAEENATQTNLEAAAEIARQLRLRDLGGLIVIDFIDMSATRNKTKVEKATRDALKGDRAKYDVTRISKLGLLEIARQRIKGAKLAASYATCPGCDGHGLIKNVEAAALAALRKLQARTARKDLSLVRLLVPGEVASWIQNNKREDLLRIEQRHGLRIEIIAKDSLLRHEIVFETQQRERSERPPKTEDPPAAERPRTAPADTKEKREPRPAGQATPTPSAPGKVVPFPAKEKDAEEPAKSASKPAEPSTTPADSAESGTKSRRRRRRKRKPRENGSTESPERDTPPSEGTVMVPRNIRSDELMPAAVGAASGGRKSKEKSGHSSGKRRGSGSSKSGGDSRSSSGGRRGGRKKTPRSGSED